MKTWARVIQRAFGLPRHYGVKFSIREHTFFQSNFRHSCSCVNSCKIKDKCARFLMSFWRPGWIISRTLRKEATPVLQEALEGSCNTVALGGLPESFMVLIDVTWNVLQSAQFLEQISVRVTDYLTWCSYPGLLVMQIFHSHFSKFSTYRKLKVHFKHTPCQTSRKE